MSRSKRKSPITGITTASSERFDKSKWHRRFRRAENQRIESSPESEPHHIRQFADPWSMAKDGKRYWRDRPDLMRK